MKIFNHWATEKERILIEGVEQEITCYGGSNTSMEEARLRAKDRAEK